MKSRRNVWIRIRVNLLNEEAFEFIVVYFYYQFYVYHYKKVINLHDDCFRKSFRQKDTKRKI